jgi:tRNA1Val (adenine37-N6)-methyltransferase
MPNNYFQFKQFCIQQQFTAMKVGTDGVLLGAWTQCGSTKKILDIGTGTGLIAIMLAQRNQTAQITAIEIEKEACNEAKINCFNSPWANRMTVLNVSLQEFTPLAQKYDLIVCNPPFFSQKAPNEKRNLARHNQKLTFNELLDAVSELLTADGLLSVVIPSDLFELFDFLAMQKKLFIKRKTSIKPTFEKNTKRVLIEYSKIQSKIFENELVVEISRHVYTPQYIQLTEDFYLNLKSES